MSNLTTMGQLLPDGQSAVANMGTAVESDDWVLYVDAVILVSFSTHLYGL
jgi:hypothetical protein